MKIVRNPGAIAKDKYNTHKTWKGNTFQSAQAPAERTGKAGTPVPKHLMRNQHTKKAALRQYRNAAFFFLCA